MSEKEIFRLDRYILTCKSVSLLIRPENFHIYDKTITKTLKKKVPGKLVIVNPKRLSKKFTKCAVIIVFSIYRNFFSFLLYFSLL